METQNTPKIQPRNMLSPAQVSKWLGVSEHTLWVWRRDRRVLPFHKLGGRILYSPVAIEAAITGNLIQPGDDSALNDKWAELSGSELFAAVRSLPITPAQEEEMQKMETEFDEEAVRVFARGLSVG